MRKSQRQRAHIKRCPSGGKLANNRVTAFAVENFAGVQIALGGRQYIGPEAGCRTGRFVSKPYRTADLLWHLWQCTA